MIRAILVAPTRFELEQASEPRPGPGEVLLRVCYVAICGSEHAPYLGIATEFPIHKHIVRYPRTLGHEASAVVAALGPGVEGLQVGQPVLPRRAPFATHAIARADELVPIPAGVSLVHAALGLMGQETYYLCHEMLRIQPWDRVLIIGLGPFGMLCLEHVREIGCRDVIAADLSEGRLALGCEFGASQAIHVGKHDLRDALAELRSEPTVVIEATGQPGPIVQAFKVAALGARIALAGRPVALLNDCAIEDLFHKLLTVIGAKIPPAGYASRYAEIALHLIKQHKIHAARLITHEFPLSRIGDAFEVATHPEVGGLKVVVKCPD